MYQVPTSVVTSISGMHTETRVHVFVFKNVSYRIGIFLKQRKSFALVTGLVLAKASWSSKIEAAS
jgi:hypothetical protein